MNHNEIVDTSSKVVTHRYRFYVRDTYTCRERYFSSSYVTIIKVAFSATKCNTFSDLTSESIQNTYGGIFYT